MCGKFQLVKPEPEIVEKYNNFRKQGNTEWNISLFQNFQSVDIREYIAKKEDGSYESPYDKYSKDDELIANYYKNDDMVNFYKKLNSVYHTRLNTSTLLELDKKWLQDHCVDDLVKVCKDNTDEYAYSFSSKVYSFVNPKENPIMDSYVSTMLWEYMDQDYKNKHKKSDWGSYDEYKQAYTLFKDNNHLDAYSFKQLDIFLWTYSVAIQNYWKQQGILEFNSVSYKAKKEKQA